MTVKLEDTPLARAVVVLLSFVTRTGRCPICEHKLGNQRSQCHCECHDDKEPFIDPVVAESYIERYWNRHR